MRAMRAIVLAGLFVVGCNGSTTKTYATYQECFDDQKRDMVETVDAIVECCIEHEVAGMKGPVCGASEPECINFLTAQLKQTDADISTQSMACATYVAEKDK